MRLKKEHIREEWEDSDGYWIALKSGFKSDSDPVGALHCIHEDTKREAWREGVLVCNCEDCRKDISQQITYVGDTMPDMSTKLKCPHCGKRFQVNTGEVMAAARDPDVSRTNGAKGGRPVNPNSARQRKLRAAKKL